MLATVQHLQCAQLRPWIGQLKCNTFVSPVSNKMYKSDETLGGHIGLYKRGTTEDLNWNLVEPHIQSIFVLLLQQKTTADTAATEVFKTRMRSLLSRTKVGMFRLL